MTQTKTGRRRPQWREGWAAVSNCKSSLQVLIVTQPQRHQTQTQRILQLSSLGESPLANFLTENIHVIVFFLEISSEYFSHLFVAILSFKT
jgi:hypothetical protein